MDLEVPGSNLGGGTIFSNPRLPRPSNGRAIKAATAYLTLDAVASANPCESVTSPSRYGRGLMLSWSEFG